MSDLLLDTLLPLAGLLGAMYLTLRRLLRSRPNWPVLLGESFFLACIAGAAALVILGPFGWMGLFVGLGFFAGGATLSLRALARSERAPIPPAPPMSGGRQSILLFSAFNDLRDPVFVVDNIGLVVFTNQAALERLGDRLGSPCMDVLGCEPQRCYECPVRGDLPDAAAEPRLETRLWGDRHYEIAMHRIRADREGRTIILARDVTERIQAERRLANQDKLTALGQLTAGIIHEINNPLTAAAANLEVLQLLFPSLAGFVRQTLTPVDEPTPEAASRRHEELIRSAEDLLLAAKLDELPGILGDMREAIDQVRKMLQDVREFSHRGGEEFKETDLNKLVRLSLRMVHYELKLIALNLDLEENMPPVHADPQQLKQALLNLFINAAQALRNHGDPRLQVETRYAAGRFSVIITDNGPGISEDALKRIFEPFYTTKEIGEGTGLGLAIVERIAQRHGGEVVAENASGGGARFTLSLPRLSAQERERILAAGQTPG
ncbi:MAG: PAS domain-containing protein [Myxococcales bacterium]|nr:MAG: PAS domain-containing protein [Myxococcales bacterium]